MIKAILFDAVGTLIHLPRGAGWHYREVAARHGIRLSEKELEAAFMAAFRSAGAREAAAGCRPDDDKGWWRDLVRRVLAECRAQASEEQFHALFKELYAHFAEPGVWALYPDARPALEALRGEYRLGVLSNWDRRLYAVLGHLGIRDWFQAVVISSETGVDKPHPRIFSAALAVLGIDAAETIHAGDDPEQDWRAAEAAGLHVYRVERPARTLEALPAYAASLRSR